MIEKGPSQTAQWLAQCRGMHLLLDDDPKIFEDTFGKILANYPDDEDWGSDNSDWHEPVKIRLRAHAVCRNRRQNVCKERCSTHHPSGMLRDVHPVPTAWVGRTAGRRGMVRLFWTVS